MAGGVTEAAPQPRSAFQSAARSQREGCETGGDDPARLATGCATARAMTSPVWCHRLAVTATEQGVDRMDIHLRLIMLQPIVALIAGVLILVMPRLLNFIVAIYLIIIGVTGLWPHLIQ
jgi:hypothetical protein